MTEKKAFVTVILCFYNEERFLREAVDSVLAQDYVDWELLLVDDGSSDGSVLMAKQYAQSNPDRILYLEHPGHANKGLSASRNLGIDHARGEFVAFIDADDVWMPKKLSNQWSIFEQNQEVTVVLESSEYWRSWDNAQHEDVVIRVGADEGTYHAPDLMLKLYPLGKGAAPCPSGVMIRRQSLKRSGFEDSFRGIYQMYEDQAFFCKVYLNEVVYVSHRCNNRYRQRAASLVSSVHESGKYHIVRQFYLSWLVQYLKTRPLRYPAVELLVARALQRYRRPVIYWIKHTLPQAIKNITARVLVRAGLLRYKKTW